MNLKLSGAARDGGRRDNSGDLNHCKQRGSIMFQAKFLLTAGALAVVALIAGGTGAARAAEIDFGSLTPTPACVASSNGGDEGLICNANGSSSATTETFTADGDTLTAKGYSDQFITQSNLTLKTVAANGLGESGLGQNAIGSTDCTDSQGGTPCEIQPGAAVSVSSSGAAITDLLVGSVQPNAEVFQLYAAAASGATLTSGDLIGTFSSNGSSSPLTSACPTYDGSNLCTFDFTTADDYHTVGLYELGGINGAASDSLITAVSVAPAPIIGQGLPVVLTVGGLLFGARLWQRSKGRRSLGSVMPHAAA